MEFEVPNGIINITKKIVVAATKDELLLYKTLDGLDESHEFFEFLVEMIALLETVSIEKAIIVMENNLEGTT